ncbi:DNA-directed RNA polymerase subunit delta [Entomoplasma freundtii]|uniref:RNAP delta factor n=1 Tax=Entomoplasma freundtii TaxID=74700 RepID=A0A2K8NTM9_9MOLU|nr:DNA-directed RNA polymerase subunit delta [Entomoplasma freundtii]ATZ16111.1 DNA directed RNA polymerase subunit delta [Entomoplasma freundtii]TDY56988.1 DNA-directed RNA polymerase subunit delta [Entomoplasma freundtii]
MTKLSNIDIAYEYLKEKKDRADFKELWEIVIQKIGRSLPNENALMAGLYSSLVCDNRFSLTPDGAWALRNNSKFEDIKKQYKNVIILKDDALDEDFDEDETTKFYNDTEEGEFETYTKDDSTFEDIETL